MDVTTSAPGKLFLFGEYGVLAGGWSVVAAVGRRVIARRREEPSGYEALGADLDDASALPRAVLAEISASSTNPVSVDQLATDIRQLFVESGEKLGLGSSAASTVALSAACLVESNLVESNLVESNLVKSNGGIDLQGRRRIFERAFAAHRRLQGGRGSCADVAASVFGGVVGYRLPQPCEPFGGCPGPNFAQDLLADTVLALEPAEVCACRPLPVRVEPIWLGTPAVSTSFVSRCEAALGRERKAVQAALCRCADIAADAIRALQHSDPSRLLDLVSQADEALERLGELIEAPIVTESHRALREQASRCGLNVKPSGAGGGDFSLVFGPDDGLWQPFLAQLPSGMRHIPMELYAGGVRAHSSD
jgi:mevalonate kinase